MRSSPCSLPCASAGCKPGTAILGAQSPGSWHGKVRSEASEAQRRDARCRGPRAADCVHDCSLHGLNQRRGGDQSPTLGCLQGFRGGSCLGPPASGIP